MNFFDFFSASKKQVLILLIGFLLLGIGTRFYHLDQPKAVVFDEFHFFHFVTEYEKGKYFFDIHPPLGKLILWANAKQYGLEEYVHDIVSEEQKQKEISQQLLQVKDEYVALQQIESANPLLESTKKRYEELEATKKQLESAQGESYDIGRAYSDTLNLWGIRSIPALFGAILVPLMFLFALLLSRSVAVASVVGMITAFDTALVTESQYVLMDSMLIFSMIAGAFFAVLYLKDASWKWWIGATVFSAMAISIKWTGASVIAFVGVIWLWNMIKNKDWIESLLKAIFFWGFTAILYIGSFWMHFMVLPYSGEGDAFHTPEFKKTLQNTVEYTQENIIPMGFWDKFYELNVQMGERSAGIRNDHPFASRPEDWIKGEKSIYYWAGTPGTPPSGIIDSAWNTTIGQLIAVSKQCFLNTRDWANQAIPAESSFYTAGTVWQQQIHLFPNPIFWRIYFALSFVAIALLIWEGILWIVSRKRKEPYDTDWIFGISGMLIMALTNIIPFVLIERPQFLYHAFEWALFSLLLLGMILGYAMKKIPQWIVYGILGVLAGGALVFFILEMPLFYGFSFPECVAPVLFEAF